MKWTLLFLPLLALGCATAPPTPPVEMSAFDLHVGTMEARRNLSLNDQLQRCGRNIDCRSRALNHYNEDLALIPRPVM
jgi:hypothetical protein